MDYTAKILPTMYCKYCGSEIIRMKFTNSNRTTCGSEECTKKRKKEYADAYRVKNSDKQKEYYEANKDELIAKSREYYKNNKETIHKRMKKWCEVNKEKIRINHLNKHHERKLIDEKYVLLRKIRSRFNNAINYHHIRKNKVRVLHGINIQSIIDHLGPCPGNRKDYHIDHIKPLGSFDLSKEDEIRIAFSPENHQWLLAADNIRKGNK